MKTTTNILDIGILTQDAKAVIFDLDDTLYSEKEYVFSGFCAVGAYYSNQKLINELMSAFENGNKPFDYVFHLHGMDKLIPEALSIYRSHQPNIHLYSGVQSMLVDIHHNRKIGIITDGRPEGQRAKLKALNVESYPFIITDELGGPQYRKPCADAFILMQSILSVPYSDMYYVGDNINKDFIAPNNLGMKCIYFNNSEGLY